MKAFRLNKYENCGKIFKYFDPFELDGLNHFFNVIVWCTWLLASYLSRGCLAISLEYLKFKTKYVRKYFNFE